MKKLLRFLVSAIIFVVIGSFPGLATNAASGLPFNGWLQTNGGYAQVPYQQEIKLEPGNGSFTIEGWLYNPFPYNVGSKTVIKKEDSFELSTFITYVNFQFNNFVMFSSCSGNVCVGSSHFLGGCAYACPPEGWVHFTYVYDQATGLGSLFWNGIRLGADEHLPNISPEPITLQGAYKMDEFRISDNVRYSANFVPALVPFVCDANTMALWHFDEIADSPILHDRCGAFDNIFVGYSGARAAGVIGSRIRLPLIIK